MEGKSKRGAGSRNLVFFVGEVKVLFCGFGFVVQGDLDSHKKHHMLGR